MKIEEFKNEWRRLIRIQSKENLIQTLRDSAHTKVCTNLRWLWSANSNFWKLQNWGAFIFFFSSRLPADKAASSFSFGSFFWGFSFKAEADTSLILRPASAAASLFPAFVGAVTAADTAAAAGWKLLKLAVDRKSNFLFSFLPRPGGPGGPGAGGPWLLVPGPWLWLRFLFSWR